MKTVLVGVSGCCQDAANHPYCRRLELKDLIPMTMQRLTKYPLLIENLMKYTPRMYKNMIS